MLTTEKPRHFLKVSDLTTGDLHSLLDLAARMRADRAAYLTAFQGGAVACYFEKPSTRTRVSFEVAAHRLGMLPIMLRPDELQIGRGETIEDTARVLSRYGDAIVMRVFSQKMLEEVAASAGVPVINALSDEHHPCQALADLLTIRSHFGRLAGLKIAYVGDANNVAHSLMEAGALAGMHVAVGCPPEYRPDPEIELRATDAAIDTGGSVWVTSDPIAAVAEADVVYSDVFVSMGNDEQAEVRRRVFAPYQVSSELMDRADRDAIFMHCLPAHRGEEVAAEVIDGPRSMVFDQAENRLHTEQALLYALITRDLEGKL